jgi:hypothetical protein
MEVLSQDNVKNYIHSWKFRNWQLHVENAMWDNFKGWGSFSQNLFGIPSKFFPQHGTSMMLYFILIKLQI